MKILAFGNPKKTISSDKKQQARSMIKFLRERGVSHLEIAQKLGLNKSSVHNWFYSGAFPSKKSFPGLLQIYQEYISSDQNAANF